LANGRRAPVDPRRPALRLGSGSLGLQCRLGFLHQGVERRLVVHGDIGQDLAIERDAGGFQTLDKTVVAQAGGAASRVDAHDPEAAPVALFLAPCGVGVLPAVLDGLLGIAEELGFVGAIFVLGALMFIFWRIIKALENSESPQGRAFITGIFLSLFVQTFVHIGMNMSLLPITGVPLPLISAGGSSFVSTMISLGIVMSTRKKNS